MRLPWRKKEQPLVIPHKTWYDYANETLREYWANVDEFEREDKPKRKRWRFWERG